MKSKEQIEFDNLFASSQKRARTKLNICVVPGCHEKAINTHILQKNGILTPLIQDNHVMQPEIQHYKGKVSAFKRRGYLEAFSFPCFCNNHDRSIFEPIESHPIDFELYSNRLLFIIRTKYNELHRKLVSRNQFEELGNLSAEKGNSQKQTHFEQTKEQEELGIQDIERDIDAFWEDYNTGSESFIIETRDISFLPICLSSFFDYETSLEITNYRRATGRHLEDLSSIFISVFPYNEKSILIMAYRKKNEGKVKRYVNTFLKESEKRLQRKITNLLAFYCETWITSESFYNKRIKACEDFFEHAAHFSQKNLNERRNFDLNLFNEKFCIQVNNWQKVNG